MGGVFIMAFLVICLSVVFTTKIQNLEDKIIDLERTEMNLREAIRTVARELIDLSGREPGTTPKRDIATEEQVEEARNRLENAQR